MSPRILALCFFIVTFVASIADGQSCAGDKVQFVSPPSQFTVHVGDMVNLKVQVNDCASQAPVTAGSVAVTSSDSNPINLSSQGNGVWTGMWMPAVAVSSENLWAVAFSANTPGLGGTGEVSGIVQQPLPPVTVSPGALTFAVVAGGSPTAQDLTISNNDSQPHTVAIRSSGGSWLSLSPAEATVQAQSTLSVPVRIDPGSLNAGPYTGSVNVTVDGQPLPTGIASIDVAVSAPAVPVQITASAYTLSFQLNTTDSRSSQSVMLTNSNGTAVDVTIQEVGSWMAVTPSKFTIAANSTQAMAVTATPGALTGGQYGGTITIQPTGGQSLRIATSLTLQTLPALSLTLNPSTLAPALSPGNAPQVLIVNLENTGPASAPFVVTVPASAAWLSASPIIGTVPAGAMVSGMEIPGSIGLSVKVDPGTLSTGTYSAAVMISTGLGESQPIQVNLTITPTGSPCVSTGLVIAVDSPASGSIAEIGQVVSIKAQLSDNCGAAILNSNGNVTAFFSSGDPSVNLAGVGAGSWEGNWTPTSMSLGTDVILYFVGLADEGSTVDGAETAIHIAVKPSGAPVVTAVSNGASFQPLPVAPGEIATIFGSNLSDCIMSATSLPLPTQVCGTQVVLGENPLPLLYVSASQINVQIPYDVTPNTSLQVMIQRDQTLSVPFNVPVGPASPAIFAVVGSTNVRVDNANPLHPGDVAIVYCTGLGAVTPAVAAGVPAEGVSSTLNPVTMTVGGVNAKVLFSGVTPQFPGLYQVDAIVPAGVVAGNAVPIVLSTSGQTSLPVSVPVQTP